MNTILYLFRMPQPGYYSIEKIFSNVATILKHRIEVKKVYAPHSKITVRNILQNLASINKSNADLFHVTGDVHYLVLGLPRHKTILTIHDCIFMYQSKGIKRWLLKNLFLKWPVKRCTLVTTISERSKADIVRFSGCSPDKVIVVPNPLDSAFYLTRKAFNTACPVILFIGSTPNKNLERVIEAVKDVNCLLDIVGQIPEQLLQAIKRNNIQYRQATGLSTAELINKYIGCDMVLFPSTYEGFGLPVIEAQQTGRVIVTSNISPLKEVAGEGACLVDPFSVASIREGVVKVIEDDAYREDIISKGIKNASQYNAEKIADAYFSLYQRLLQS